MGAYIEDRSLCAHPLMEIYEDSDILVRMGPLWMTGILALLFVIRMMRADPAELALRTRR